MRDQHLVTRTEHARLRRFDDGPHTFVADTIERVIEPLVGMVGVHPVIYADRGDLRFNKDTTRFDPWIGSFNEFDLTGFRHGQDDIVLRVVHCGPLCDLGSDHAGAGDAERLGCIPLLSHIVRL